MSNDKVVKVLLVEDLLIPARAVTRLLSKKNCQIDWVKTGKEAIDKSKLGYNFILLDLGLPDIDELSSNLVYDQ